MPKKPRILSDIEKDAIHRKSAKAKFDAKWKLAKHSDGKPMLHTLAKDASSGKVRLLDEGAVVQGGDWISMYIKKGVLSNFMEHLSNDYVGTINYGHNDFARDPILLGTWTKEDLELVDIGDGRQALDVNLNLDKQLHRVQDLYRNAETIPGYKIGVSAEFTTKIDYELSEEMGTRAIRELDILDFAVVGDAGNVNSGEIELSKQEGEQMAGEKKKKRFTEMLLESLKRAGWKDEEPEEEIEEPEEEQEEEQEEEPDDTEEEKEEIEEPEEEQEEEPDDTEEEEAEELAAVIKTASDQLTELKQSLEELKTEKDKLEERLGKLQEENTDLKQNGVSDLKRLQNAVRNTSFVIPKKEKETLANEDESRNEIRQGRI